MSERRPTWWRAVAVVLAVVGMTFGVVAVLKAFAPVPVWASRIFYGGPGAFSLLLLLPAVRPCTQAGALCRFVMLAVLGSHAVVVCALMAGAAVTPNRWAQLFHMMGAFMWAVIITPFGAVVCLALLTAAALRAERTAFLCVAGSALALPLSVLLGRFS